MNLIEGLASRFRREPEPINTVTQLIRTAEGKARFSVLSMELERADVRQPCYSLRNNIYAFRMSPKIVHQLRALRELGESGSKKAFDYLQKLYVPKQISYCADYNNYSEGSPDYYTSYPNAKKPLSELLEWDNTHPERLDYEPHLTIRTAIANLEKSLSG
jgi:hypothetical protein